MSSLTLTELSQASPSILPVNNGSILTFHPEFFPRLESYLYHICSDPMFLFHSVCLLELALYRERIFSIHLSLKLWSWWEKTYIHHVFMTTTNAREKLIKIRRHLFGLMGAEVHDQLSQLFWGRASWRGGRGAWQMWILAALFTLMSSWLFGHKQYTKPFNKKETCSYTQFLMKTSRNICFSEVEMFKEWPFWSIEPTLSLIRTNNVKTYLILQIYVIHYFWAICV